MLLSLNWLREFVPYEGTAEALGDRLTMLGLELEEVIRPYEGIKDVVLGRVLTCGMHPDSDHLHVTTVDIGATGEDPLTIVCGAPNVAAGQLVAVAPVGAVLPGGFAIKKAKLRGVPSFGMICSERELGLNDDHSGILVLPETNRAGRTPKLGEAFISAYELDREVLNISITPNRADCLSILGLAREVAAAFQLPLTMPAFQLEEHGDPSPLAIEIIDPEFCPAYTGRVIENAHVAPSPAWLRYRLHAVGVRSISNLVDVTNYILMELGQPLHAFDSGKLAGNKIIVAPAKDGMTLMTLDGQERQLKDGDGLICDTSGAIALAGVMGGLSTEITSESHTVFLECAQFRPASVRRTGRRLGLSSESSYRFERGVDQTGMDFARDRAAALMAELSGGRVRKGVCQQEPRPFIAPVVRFRREKAEALLGVPLDDTFCINTLTRLGCRMESAGQSEWNVTSPGWRYDLTREADLIEEVARYQGVDTMPATLPALTHTLDRFGLPESRYLFLSRIKHWAAGMGLNEAVNYSFVGNSDLDHLHLPKEGRVNILNPLTAEQDVLRTDLAPGLLQAVRNNIAQGAAGLRLFEVAQSFHLDATQQTTVFEQRHLAFAFYGARHDTAWNHAEADMDYVDIKGVIEHFFRDFLHLPLPLFTLASDHPYLAPAVTLTLPQGSGSVSDPVTTIGTIGRVKPDLADAYHARKPIWLADLELDTLQALAAKARPAFRALPVYPPVRRDITVMASASVISVASILAALNSVKAPLLENIELLDIYEPQSSTTRNITFRLTFRHPERTLQDAEVDREREKLVTALVQALPVKV